jgi:hypothetical protein
MSQQQGTAGGGMAQQGASSQQGMTTDTSGMAQQTDTSGMAQQGAATDQSASGQATASSGNIRFVTSERVQAVADTGPATGNLPVCSANQTDNCINAWEAGRRGAGVNRPLESYPGERRPNRR